jgi:DNA-binding transcriptional MerR regulator
MTRDGMLKMSELAERSGVSAGTIKHYLREGLLGGEDTIVRTSRNMAWYAPALVERVKLIKRLQEERFMPLKLIRGVLGADPERARALIELEDRILEQAAAAQESERMSAAEARRRFERYFPSVADLVHGWGEEPLPASYEVTFDAARMRSTASMICTSSGP